MISYSLWLTCHRKSIVLRPDLGSLRVQIVERSLSSGGVNVWLLEKVVKEFPSRGPVQKLRLEVSVAFPCF